MHIQAHYPLRQLNTFHVPATTRYLVEIDRQSDIRALRSDPVLASLPWYVLGGGSNVLITRDLEGVVVRSRFRALKIIDEDEDSLWISVGAGMDWHELVDWSVRRNLWGLENLALIPGTVGAAPVQNIGAYGVEVQDAITRVIALDLFTGEQRAFRNAECEFTYRGSIFKAQYANELLVHRVTFRLRKLHASRPNLLYTPLAEAVRDIPEDQLTPRHIFDAIVAIRRSRLPDPEKEGNAGSFFKNPLVDAEYLETLKATWPDIVYHSTVSGQYKIPAAWLIEACGWKGKCLEDAPDACVSDRHALVLINRGQATGRDILRLAKTIQKDVMHTFGIHLEPEVVIL